MQKNFARIKPGVTSLFLIYSDLSSQRVFQFPVWASLRPALEPLLDAVGAAQGIKNIEKGARNSVIYVNVTSVTCSACPNSQV